MVLTCPRCDSGDVRRLSIIFESGTADVLLQSQTIGVASFGFGAASTGTSGKHQSLLAIQSAPPSKPKEGKLGLIQMMVGLLLMILGIAEIQMPRRLGIAGGIFAAVLGVVLIRVGWLIREKQRHYNHVVWQQTRDAWENSFLCMRCGTRFESKLNE